jgi:hypothetical protein
MATTTARVKLHFRIKELEFDLEADKDDAPQIANSVARQLGNLLDPVDAGTSSRKFVLPARSTDLAAEPIHDVAPAKARKARAARNGSGASTSPPAAFAHDVEKFGFPEQAFSTLEKSLYVLYVAEAQGAPRELSAVTVTNWFNQIFKSAGAVRGSNVSKYLRGALTAKPAPVGEDVTKSPSVWYLTTEGRKTAEQLVIRARGQGATA